MTAQEYLSQAYRINLRIKAKREQINELECLITNISPSFKDVDVQKTPNPHSMSDTIDAIIDMERELNEEAKRLVALLKEIRTLIESVEDTDQRLLLELRYLCDNKWEEIAVKLGYSMEHTFRLHKKALKNIEISER